MNGTGVYRVTEVLAGASPTAAVLAMDAAGREVRLEIPVEQARSLTREAALVLSWSVHSMPAPELVTPSSTPRSAAAGAPPLLLDESLDKLDAGAEREMAVLFGRPTVARPARTPTTRPGTVAAPTTTASAEAPVKDAMNLLLTGGAANRSAGR